MSILSSSLSVIAFILFPSASITAVFVVFGSNVHCSFFYGFRSFFEIVNGIQDTINLLLHFLNALLKADFLELKYLSIVSCIPAGTSSFIPTPSVARCDVGEV